MDSRKSVTTEICAILCIDTSNFFYRACSLCERTLPEDHPASRCCIHCANRYATSASAGSKLLFRVLMSIATDEKVFNVICFDRVARALFGCSADEFWDFARLHPFATAAANRVLEGELFRMSLSTPKNDYVGGLGAKRALKRFRKKLQKPTKVLERTVDQGCAGPIKVILLLDSIGNNCKEINQHWTGCN
ncbi:hypothetical protein SAY87_013481 [Trapa incisa]|uniref:Replication factor A C-terminal domain-containing protein n=1 Tax=Trapa incisa TaxID=236973 RepID=A0AAN7QDD0_9MYRT|nr:hypothetical protein SAY87_013481 [Trapa incisa]